jgi:cytoskeletal protein CcmA (bactofilin family)/ribosomal protein S27E
MPATKQDKVEVTCPHCGHTQPEPRGAFSTVCKKCRGHIRLDEVLKPAKKKKDAAPPGRQVTCFDCGAHQEVALTAQSTMCKKCSRYMDLKDYKIANAVSKNFRTRGSFAIEATGYVFNTEAVVGDAVIKGRFLGKLHASGSLTIHTSAEIKGSIKGGNLIIPAANRFRWQTPIEVESAEIAGELAANLNAGATVTVKATGRLFGDIAARNLVVEPGAVIVGQARIGGPAKEKEQEPEKPKARPPEPAKETTKATMKEPINESAKEAAKETTRKATREIQREMFRDTPKEIIKEPARTPARQTAKDKDKEKDREMPRLRKKSL